MHHNTHIAVHHTITSNRSMDAVHNTITSNRSMDGNVS